MNKPPAMTRPVRKVRHLSPSSRKPSSGRWRRKQLAGLILILVGVIFLLSNFGLFWWWDWDTTWPVIIMGVGLFLLVGNTRGKEAR